MSAFAEQLRQRAERYRMGGPSSEHTAILLERAAAKIDDMGKIQDYANMRDVQIFDIQRAACVVLNDATSIGVENEEDFFQVSLSALRELDDVLTKYGQKSELEK